MEPETCTKWEFAQTTYSSTAHTFDLSRAEFVARADALMNRWVRPQLDNQQVVSPATLVG